MPVANATINVPELSVAWNAPDASPDQQPWPLKIYTLGRFGLVLDGIPLHFSGKVPRKPLELIKALIAGGGRGVSEELLIDQLWLNSEADNAARSLSSALHRLRHLLGNACYIRRQDRRITLDADFCWVDVWVFERLYNQALFVQNEEFDRLPALNTAQQAIMHYTGHFLPADEDQQWSISMREQLRCKMLKLITIVGQHWEEATDWHTALAIYQKGLEVDDLCENFYQRQMICHRQLGNHGEIASAYQRCRCTLAIHGVKPSPKTTSIFESAIFLP